MRDEAKRVIRLNVVARRIWFWQNDIWAFGFGIGNKAEKVGDAVQPLPASFSDRNNMPGRVVRVGALEHVVSRA